VIQAATEGGDFAPFHELVMVLSRPYEDQPGFTHYADPPQPHELVQKTFCGK
jgi:serine/tyrosine/threonine adenylyltransferase